jgi:ketosteroid isomerase-like protein
MLRRSERAFAKATSEIGFRNGFLMFFADDALAPPSTEPARRGLLAIPAPVEPRVGDLVWEPLFGDVARSVDMGYLTGPSSFTGRDGKRHTGVYFSIWRRGPDGLWKVVLDAGVDMPGPAPEFASGEFKAPEPSQWEGRPAAVKSGDLRSLRQAERELASHAARDLAGAYEQRLAPEARLHREHAYPVLGREAIVQSLRQTSATMARHRLLRAETSTAGDMGWTFGTCEWTAADTTRPCTISRVWKRDREGRWQVVVDVLNPPRQ